MSEINFLGLVVPDAGPVFLTALGIHVLAGSTCVVAGALAATARKRRGRHPIAGRVYLWGLVVVFLTASMMAVIRWEEDRHLLAIAVVALGLAMWGWWSRRHPRRSWWRAHAWGMGGSYIALLTGFYVDNGPQLPLWDRLPHWAFWVLPACVGVPLVWWALRRYRAGATSRPRAAAPVGAPRLRRR